MKAELKCYNGNADLFVDGGFHLIRWDGYEFKNELEWKEWAEDVLSPAKGAENYDDVNLTLYIHTNYLIKE